MKPLRLQTTWARGRRTELVFFHLLLEGRCWWLHTCFPHENGISPSSTPALMPGPAGHFSHSNCMKGFSGGLYRVCFTQLQEKKKSLLHDSESSSFFSAFTVSSTQILHSVSLLKQLYFLPPFLHLYFFLMSNSDSKMFLSFIPISDSIQSPAHVLIFLAELYSVNTFVSLAREQKYLQANSFPFQTALGE